MNLYFNPFCILFSVFYVISICTTITNGEIQQVHLYNPSSSCNSSPIKTINNSVNNVNASTFSSMSLLGMWQIWTCPSTNFNCGSVVSTYVINYNPIPFCVGKTSKVLYNFRMLGDGYQTAPEIYLYSSMDFSGQVVKVTHSTPWTSSSFLSLGSYWFTGRHAWTLFSEESFKGSKTCLKPSSQVFNQGWGFNFNTTLTNGISIKSAKYGCNRGSQNGGHFLIVLTLLFCSSFIFIKIWVEKLE